MIDGWDDNDPFAYIPPSNQGFTLTAELSSVVQATGKNYADAFIKLLQYWSPDDTTNLAPFSIEGTVE